MHRSGTTFPATPPLIPTAFSPSRYSSPSIGTRRGSYAASRASTSPAAWIAFVPIQDRAECARSPRVVTSIRMVPWQPASTTAFDGSITTANTPSSSSGLDRVSLNRPFRSASTSSQS